MNTTAPCRRQSPFLGSHRNDNVTPLECLELKRLNRTGTTKEDYDSLPNITKLSYDAQCST
jgi:hypothetical protein